MQRNEKKKLLKTLADLSTALREAAAVAEAAVATATATQALLARSESNAEQWRQLCEAAQRPVSVSVPDEIKPLNGWVN
ncbi:MAG: hypothetical protein WB562_02930 [Candidatus Sulfotelmatobacter sp.]